MNDYNEDLQQLGLLGRMGMLEDRWRRNESDFDAQFVKLLAFNGGQKLEQQWHWSLIVWQFMGLIEEWGRFLLTFIFELEEKEEVVQYANCK